MRRRRGALYGCCSPDARLVLRAFLALERLARDLKLAPRFRRRYVGRWQVQGRLPRPFRPVAVGYDAAVVHVLVEGCRRGNAGKASKHEKQ